MIKIENNLLNATPNPLCEVINDQKIIEALEYYGVELGKHDGDHDYIFEYANECDNPQPNTVAFERIDGPQIKHRKLISNENIIALVKMYAYSDNGTHNLSCLNGRPLTRLILPEAAETLKLDFEKQSIKLTDQDLSKVFMGPNFLHYHRMKMLVHDYSRIGKQERDIDISFAGTVEYSKNGSKSGELIGNARTKCADTILNMGDRYSVDVVKGRNLGRREYLKRLLRSKIVVSPWGWGEACYRDYEAILAGCQVIKPASYNIKSCDDLFSNNGPIKYCKADFSDLKEVVVNAIHVWNDEEPERASTASAIRVMQSPMFVASVLYDIIYKTQKGLS